MRATEASVTFTNDIVTQKTLLCVVSYHYDGEGALKRKVITPTGGDALTVYYETVDDKTVVKLAAGGKNVVCHSTVDSFGRKTFDEIQTGAGFLTREFDYLAGEVTAEHLAHDKLKSAPTTQLVSRIVFSDGREIEYEYDAEERITKVTDSVDGVTEYTYDELGQLLTERVNGHVVNSMTYDGYGNILSKNGKLYTYANVWKDLLLSVDGTSITYDAQGNPTSYLGHALVWEKGRQLKSFDGNSYTYNANGIRTSKTVGGIKHDYLLDGTKILRETWGENVLIPLYDNEDGVCGIEYNGTAYFFRKNLQGDVIAIANASGTTVATYSYDAWGVCTILSDSTGIIASVNPFRYRSYYYDGEIAMYYLQSRYYDPIVGRFIKSDIPEMMLLQVKKTTGTNLFAYCNNDAIGGNDPMGILNAAGVASWLSASSVFAMFAESLYTAFTATMTKIGLYITGILTPKAAAAFWWQPWIVVGIVIAAVAIVLAAVSNARSQAISKADAKVKSTVKHNAKYQYWSATFRFGYVDIGRGLSYTQAVVEVAAGRNVFAVTKTQAYKVAFAAGGNATPLLHPKHQNSIGYYKHYHVKGHSNGAHVWYLF